MSLLAFSLVPLAMLFHVLAARYFGRFRKWPFAELAMMALSLGWLLWLLLQTRPVGGGLIALNGVAWALVGFFFWWTQRYSAFASTDGSIRIGEDARAALSIDGLIDERGAPMDPCSILSHSDATLWVFYRGHW